MNMKKLLALALALCMVLPMVSCKKGEGSETGTTTTVQQNADVTDGEGGTTANDEGGTTVNGEGGTTVTGADGEVVVPTDADGKTQATKKPVSGTTKAPGRTTTSLSFTTASRPNIAGYVGKDIKLKEGTVRSDKGVDFGGKTFLYAFANTEQRFKDEFAEFERRYNGKIKQIAVSSVESIAAATAGGTKFDMLMMSTDTYPSQITSNLVRPVTDYLTTADLWDTEHPEKGGLSFSMMKQFSWNNEAYCLAGAYLCGPYVIFYNKKMFNDAGLEDPLKLYKQGKWTWEKFLEMGREITDADKNLYMVNSIASHFATPFFASYDTDIVTLKDGVMKENLSDKKLYNAMLMLREMHYGEGAIVNKNLSDLGKMGYEAFSRGTTATFQSSAGHWGQAYAAVEGKAAFDGKTSNIGVVPVPVQNTAGVHALWGMQGYCAGVATQDPRFVVCWALMDSTINHAEVYVDSTPAEIKKVLCDVVNTDKLRAPSGTYKSSLGQLPTLTIANKACAGEDITKVLASYKRQVQRLLDAATAQ